MSKEQDEKVVKEIIEYANQEIKNSKKKYLTIFLSIVGTMLFLAALFWGVFQYEMPEAYSKDMMKVYVPIDQGLDINIDLPNYKRAKAVLVKTENNTLDLYINVTQTVFTKIIEDRDKTNNLLRVGNNSIGDYQSESISGFVPDGYDEVDIKHVYYVDKMTKKMMVMDNREWIDYDNKVLIWTRD